MLQGGIDVARSKVGVMGITFKENCPDIRNSRVVDLVRELEAWGVTVLVADPWADPADLMHEYGIELNNIDANSNLNSLIVAVGHTEFRNLSSDTLRSYCGIHHNPVIGDLKALYERDNLQAAGFNVFRF